MSSSCLPAGYSPTITYGSRVRPTCPFNIIDTDKRNKILNDAQMLYKAIVLKNISNSSRLTKNQIISKISQGNFTSKTKSFASQSSAGLPTNPNTKNFLREGNILLGNTIVNPYTHQIIKQTVRKECFHVSCSDVPPSLTIKDLCFINVNPQLRYPKQTHRKMPTATNKNSF